MIATLQRSLFAIAAGLIAVDLAWAGIAHFQLDGAAYLRLAVLALALVGGAIFYQLRRAEPAIVAMLAGTGFLCAYSAAASVLNYFLLTLHGPRMDAALAAADRALGFDWVAAMTLMANHPRLNGLLFFSYNIELPEIALIAVILGCCGKAETIYRYCLAVALGALTCIFVWALAPSFGAMSVFDLPPAVSRALAVSVDRSYGDALVAMLRDGPGFISPADMRGLIGFPSYHGVLALIAIFYARGLPNLFWPVLALNVLALIATPIQGGHHLIDVLASFPVAALVLFLSSLRGKESGAAKSAGVVNKSSKWAAAPYAAGRFSAGPAKD